MSDTVAIAALNAAKDFFVVKYGNKSVLHVYFDSAEMSEAWMWECPRLPPGIDAVNIRLFCDAKNHLDFQFSKADLEAFQERRPQLYAELDRFSS